MESRQEYPAILASLSPDQAVNVFNDRVSTIKQVNSSIADWLQERRKVEEAYVQGLRKLAGRPQQDGGAALGIFQTPWQRIVSGTENLAASHEVLAQKIENDVEGPLRRFNSSSREMQAVSSSHGNLASIAKGLESAQKKAARGGKKGEEATSSIDEASRSWESQAPYVFEQLQALDERRINHLRDVLTQLQTHEVDQVERARVSAESCLNALLSLETSEEISNFVAKSIGGRANLARRRSSAAASARPPSSSTQAPPLPPQPRASQRDQATASHPNQDRLAPPEQTPSMGRLGGLKRLGTVMNRRKSVVPPPPPSAEKRERKTRPFSAFRRGDSSRSFQDLESTGQDLTPVIPEESRNELTQVQSTVTETPASFTPPARSPPITTVVDAPVTNGTTHTPQPVSHPTPAPQISQPYERPQQDRLDPMSVLLPSAKHAQPVSPQEMPTHASPGLQQEPFSAADSDDASRRFAIRDEPIAEDEGEAQQAMSNMANQLRMQAQTSGLNRVQGSVRGRRDVRNTMFVPTGVDTSFLSPVGSSGVSHQLPATSSLAQSPDTSELASPIAKPPPRTIHDENALGSDTTSVHSSRSLATAQPHHPDLHGPGLNASIIETVNTWFTESGVSRSFVTGEIALAYNASVTSPTPEKELIRLQQFELLEKVAANPVFVTSSPNSTAGNGEETAGTYAVTLSSIRRSTPTVGLKYQLHIDDSALARYSPLLITPAWQLVEGQASIIVLYSLNPAFAATTSDPVVLKNVIIAVSLDPSAATPQSAMMAPQQGASFRRKANSVIWRLNDLSLRQEQERLLVRFLTPGGIAKKGSVEVKFELQGRAGSSIALEKRTVKEKDPFADEERVSEDGEGKWEGVSTTMGLVSGRYSAA